MYPCFEEDKESSSLEERGRVLKKRGRRAAKPNRERQEHREQDCLTMVLILYFQTVVGAPMPRCSETSYFFDVRSGKNNPHETFNRHLLFLSQSSRLTVLHLRGERCLQNALFFLKHKSPVYTPFKRMRLCCLQLEASCLQRSFFTYS